MMRFFDHRLLLVTQKGKGDVEIVIGHLLAGGDAGLNGLQSVGDFRRHRNANECAHHLGTLSSKFRTSGPILSTIWATPRSFGCSMSCCISSGRVQTPSMKEG